MYSDLTGKIILSITRRDEFSSYDFFCPLGLYFDFGEQRGLFIGIRNDKAIEIDLMTKDQLSEWTGFEYSECDLNELKEDDELKKFIGQKIETIKIAEYKDLKIKGDSFDLLLGGYAGIKIKTEDNELVYYNENGGYLSINDGGKIPNVERWTWK